MEKLSDAKERLRMNARYDFLTRNYLASEMNDFVVVDHFSQTGVPARGQEKWSKKDVYSFFIDVDDLDKSILDFSNVHDQNCRQYLSRANAFPFFDVIEGGQEKKEDYYQKIKHHTFPAQQIYPFTYHREFNTNTFDTRGKYNVIEVCEDFRHFHGLYPKNNVNNVEKYFKETDLNTEEEVAVVKNDDDYWEVKIKKQDLCRYLHYTKRALIIQFHFYEETKYSFAELDEAEEVKLESDFPLKGNDFCEIQGAIKYGNDHHWGHPSSWSLLAGLAILLSPPMGDSYGDREAIRFRFCIGLDNIGNKEYLDLDDNWWKLPLEEKTKSVYFDSSVLDHFYENNGSEYIIYDQFDDECPPLYRDILICSPDEYQFSIPLSFHNDDVVYCDIENLGRPKKELFYFQRYNIVPPSIYDMNTSFRDSEISLKEAYYWLRDRRPYMIKLSEGEDESLFFKKIRIPRKVSQEYFDRLIHHLTKLLIEGIQTVNFDDIVNKKSQNGEPYERKKKSKDNAGKINALATLFRKLELIEPEGKKHIAFLNSLKNYRNTSVAHAKPEDWRKSLEELEVVTNDLKGGVATIFEKSKSFLHFLDRCR